MAIEKKTRKPVAGTAGPSGDAEATTAITDCP